MEDTNNPPAVTIESLQAELQVEQAAHLATQGELQAEQTAHGATQEALATAQAQTAEAGNALAQATGIIAGQKATIEEQEAKIIALQTSPAEFPTITVDKVEYEVRTKGFKYNSVDYSVEQLLKDKKLQKELVGKGVGFLIKKEA